MDWAGKISLFFVIVLGLKELYSWYCGVKEREANKRAEEAKEIARQAEIKQFKENCISSLTADMKDVQKVLDKNQRDIGELTDYAREAKGMAEDTSRTVKALFNKQDQMRDNVIRLNTTFVALLAVLRSTKTINGSPQDPELKWGND